MKSHSEVQLSKRVKSRAGGGCHRKRSCKVRMDVHIRVEDGRGGEHYLTSGISFRSNIEWLKLQSIPQAYLVFQIVPFIPLRDITSIIFIMSSNTTHNNASKGCTLTLSTTTYTAPPSYAPSDASSIKSASSTVKKHLISVFNQKCKLVSFPIGGYFCIDHSNSGLERDTDKDYEGTKREGWLDNRRKEDQE